MLNDMYYNIYFEIAAIIILFMIIIGRKAFFEKKDKLTSEFFGVIGFTLVTCIVNIIAALCYDCIIPNSDKGMLVVETVYLLFAMYCCYAQLRVVCLSVGYESDVFRLINFYLLIVVSVALLINLGPGIIFEYVDHKFLGHPLFYATYIIYIAFFLEMLIVLYLNRSMMRRKQLILTTSLFIFPAVCILLQLLFDRYLLSELGATMAFLVFCFTLGDRDYEEYQQVAKELQASGEAIQKSREEANKANRVKTLFIRKMSAELGGPIKEILDICYEAGTSAEDSKTLEYIDRISEGGRDLNSFFCEIEAMAKED